MGSTRCPFGDLVAALRCASSLHAGKWPEQAQYRTCGLVLPLREDVAQAGTLNWDLTSSPGDRCAG